VGLLLDGGGLVADVSGLKQQLFSQLLVRSFFLRFGTVSGLKPRNPP
jgi:hypothetical protein